MSEYTTADTGGLGTSAARPAPQDAATAAPWARATHSSSSGSSSGSTTRPDMLPPLGSFGQAMPIGPMASMPQLPVMPPPGSVPQLASTQLRTGKPVAGEGECRPLHSVPARCQCPLSDRRPYNIIRGALQLAALRAWACVLGHLVTPPLLLPSLRLLPATHGHPHQPLLRPAHGCRPPHHVVAGRRR